MFALAHKETGKFVGWEVFTNYLDGDMDWYLTPHENSNNVWVLDDWYAVVAVQNIGKIDRGLNGGYYTPNVDFDLDDYEIVSLTGVKV